MEWNITLLLVMYITCGLSIAGSLFVAVNILRFGHARISTQLVLYLHLGQILQDVVAIPTIYYRHTIVCKIVGFFHMYSGLANVVTVAIMALVYRTMFFHDLNRITKWCSKHAAELIFLFPLICLIPFSTNSYGPIHDSFCSLLNNNMFYYLLPGLPMLLIGAFSWLCFTVTITEVYLHDRVMGRKFLKSIGLYAITTLLFWIPRITIEMSAESSLYSAFAAYMLVYVSGIVFCLIFLREKRSLRLFELDKQFSSNNLFSDSDSTVNQEERQEFLEELEYSWEEDEQEAAQNNPFYDALSGCSSIKGSSGSSGVLSDHALDNETLQESILFREAQDE